MTAYWTGSRQTYVECPHCGVRYPWEKLYSDNQDRPAEGRIYTVVCALCHCQFDVAVRRRWSLRGRTLRTVVRG